MNKNNNQLLAIIIGLSFTVAFILGITTISVTQNISISSRLKIENETLKRSTESLDLLKEDVATLTNELRAKNAEIFALTESTIWKLFRPYRKILEKIRAH